MTRSLCAIVAATTALVLVPSAAVAQYRVAVQAHVPVADLDLSNATGRTRFTDRLRRAASHACGAGTGASLAERADIARCRREMMSDAVVQLAAQRAPVRVAQVAPAR